MNKLEFRKTNITASLPRLDRVVWITPSTFQGRQEVVVYTNTLEYLRDHPDGADIQVVQYLIDRGVAVGFLPITEVVLDGKTISGKELLSKRVDGELTIYSKSVGVSGLRYYFEIKNGRHLLTIKNRRFTERFYVSEYNGEVGEADGLNVIPVNMLNKASEFITIEATNGDMDEDKWNSFIGTSNSLVVNNDIKSIPNIYRNPTFYTAYSVAASIRAIDLDEIPIEWHPDFIIINAPAGGELDGHEEGLYMESLDELAAAARSQVLTIESASSIYKGVTYTEHMYWYWNQKSGYTWRVLCDDIPNFNYELFSDWLNARCGFPYAFTDRAARFFSSGGDTLDVAELGLSESELKLKLSEMQDLFYVDFGLELPSKTWVAKNIPDPIAAAEIAPYEYSVLYRQVSDTEWKHFDYLRDNSISLCNDYVIVDGARIPTWSLYVVMLYTGDIMTRVSSKYKFQSMTREEIAAALPEESPYVHNINTISKDDMGIYLDMPWMQNSSVLFDTFVRNIVLGAIHRACLRDEITRDNLVSVLEGAANMARSYNWTESCSYSYNVEGNTADVTFKTTLRYMLNKTISVDFNVQLNIK